MTMTFKDYTSYNEEKKIHIMDKMELIIDDRVISTLTFKHDEKDVEVEVDNNATLEELESIFSYRNSFNQISQMIFMDIGYKYFQMLEKQDPEKAKELAKLFQEKK